VVRAARARTRRNRDTRCVGVLSRRDIIASMNIGRCLIAILLLAVTGLCMAQQSSDFNGEWVLKFNGQPIFKLRLAAEKGGITGSWTKPRQLTIDLEGDVATITPDQVNLPIQKAALSGGQLELTINGDRFLMTMEDHNRASLVEDGMPPWMHPWHLERAADGDSVVLATHLPEPDYPQEIRALRGQLRTMVAEDQEARFAFDEARIQAVDAKNRPEVLRIFDRYGWVTNSVAGKDAAHNFWVLVQHQTLEIQQRLLPALEKAAHDSNASMSDYAYLFDRVQTGLGKPQHWGTQTKCEKGKPVLYPVEDPAGLDLRRKELFMPPVRDYLQTDYLMKYCAQTGK
jgi:uncharacterized protein DUF6624